MRRKNAWRRLRTAAMSAVAAKHLARRGSRSMALIGNGAQSEFQAIAFQHLVGIDRLRVVKALILLTYGVGNAPQDERLLGQLREASKRGVILLNLSQCLHGKVNMGGYATGNALSRAGVISGFDMTAEAALTKLHFLLSQDLPAPRIRELMQQSLRGELTP